MTMGSKRLRSRGGTVAFSVALVAGSALTAGMTAGSAAAAQTGAVTRLEANLRGSMGGDTDGSGHATLRFFRAKRQVCATVTWSRIGRPNAAHIHRSSDGGVVVGLTGSVTGGAHCAHNVPRATISRIVAHPQSYYFNVHNAAYPAGAIRGTLHR